MVRILCIICLSLCATSPCHGGLWSWFVGETELEQPMATSALDNNSTQEESFITYDDCTENEQTESYVVQSTTHIDSIPNSESGRLELDISSLRPGCKLSGGTVIHGPEPESDYDRTRRKKRK
jgi:hypothetical protein